MLYFALIIKQKMISVCIPIYNFNVTNLVEGLLHQIKKLESKVEIILIDDASKVKYREINSKFKNKCKYVQLEKNIGRSRIRNLFLYYVNYEYLLFLDCDGRIIQSDFLSKYTRCIKKYPNSVIYGGRVYPEKQTNNKEKLAWRYGVKTESKPASIRKKYPRKYFMTNNFIVPRKVFNKVRFDEEILQYGYEDTLFGFELKKIQISINHIDNPVLNNHLEENLTYLRKEEKAIQNLVYILRNTTNKMDLINEIKLLKTYFYFKKIEILIRLIFWLTKKPIRLMVKNSIISLHLFNFYKLGYLSVQLKNT